MDKYVEHLRRSDRQYYINRPFLLNFEAIRLDNTCVPMRRYVWKLNEKGYRYFFDNGTRLPCQYNDCLINPDLHEFLREERESVRAYENFVKRARRDLLQKPFTYQCAHQYTYMPFWRACDELEEFKKIKIYANDVITFHY